jgi:hypothetical protein
MFKQMMKWIKKVTKITLKIHTQESKYKFTWKKKQIKNTALGLKRPR